MENKISFIELARLVLDKCNKPLTVDEIWNEAEKDGLLHQLETVGKTPKATLAARLYTEVKRPGSAFGKIGARPAKFILQTTLKKIPKETLAQISEIPPSATTSFSFAERELHPLLVRFAKDTFEADCKTIFHEKPVKKGLKHNQWLHPDIAGFALNSQDWGQEVVDLAQRSGAEIARLYSFEIKIEVNFQSLREFFFQAVSNSSWAHEGYLVAAEINQDPKFLDEITRLSQSFGIGIIHLNIKEPEESRIFLPARKNDEVDWETINRIAEDNPDFKGFVASVAKSINVNQIVAKEFDRVFEDKELIEHLKKLNNA
jgi:uncharacterized protein